MKLKMQPLQANFKRTKNAILRYFADSDMRCSHAGLTQQAEKSGFELKDLGLGEYLVFVNRKHTMMKILTVGNVIAFQKMPDKRYIDLKVISLIPKYFSGGVFNIEAAVRQRILEHLKK